MSLLHILEQVGSYSFHSNFNFYMNGINMAALISHFPVLMEIKIQPLSLTGQLAVLMLLPLLTWQLS